MKKYLKKTAILESINKYSDHMKLVIKIPWHCKLYLNLENHVKYLWQ